ncbi:MAG: EpsI family protein [Caulobacterales bacterium]|nr:EpsI family protein [Caulobacterales bacterium]
MKRRDLVFGAMGLAALGVGEALRPRKKLMLLKSGTIATALPVEFGHWSARDSDNLINPATAGRLTRALYSQLVMREYTNLQTGADIMLLAAYGDTQSDLLQLHRPESCYPAVGFTLKRSEPALLDLGDGAKLPVRRVVAQMQDRTENIVYWTRMGEALPQSGEEQRAQRISNSIHGFIPDGILMRASLVGEPDASFQALDQFVPDLLRAIAPPLRMAFVGSPLASVLNHAQVARA